MDTFLSIFKGQIHIIEGWANKNPIGTGRESLCRARTRAQLKKYEIYLEKKWKSQWSNLFIFLNRQTNFLENITREKRSQRKDDETSKLSNWVSDSKMSFIPTTIDIINGFSKGL